MTCEVAKPPFSDAGTPGTFDINNDHNSEIDLSAISGFNSDYDGIDQGYINPQSLSNAGSPAYNDNSPMTPNFTSNDQRPDFMSTPASPYFLTDQSLGTPFIPSALHNQYLHRRSVSEPPDGAIMHHLPPSNAAIIFSRDGHKLGEPATHIRPIKKIKQSRVQAHRGPQRHQPPMQSRYHLRRPYNQSMHVPPTSVPVDMSTPNSHIPPLQQPHPRPFHPGPPQQHFVSSRVCTPSPEAIDPSLEASPAQMDMGELPPVNNTDSMGNFAQSQVTGSSPTSTAPRAVMIKMGVEELRALITDVVQQAVEGLRTSKDTIKEEDDNDEIVVAGCASRETEDSNVEIDE